MILLASLKAGACTLVATAQLLLLLLLLLDCLLSRKRGAWVTCDDGMLASECRFVTNHRHLTKSHHQIVVFYAECCFFGFDSTDFRFVSFHAPLEKLNAPRVSVVVVLLDC